MNLYIFYSLPILLIVGRIDRISKQKKQISKLCDGMGDRRTSFGF